MIELRPSTQGQKREIYFGSECVSYYLEQDERNSLRITVFPELHVRVKAPFERSLDEIDTKVKKRAAWIIKQQEFFRQFLPLPPERRYVSGESHYYLGRQYRLKVIELDRANSVKLSGRYLEVCVKNRKDKLRVAELLNDWHRDRAHAIFMRQFDKCLERVAKHGIKKPVLRIQRMTKRWGSFTENGTMVLNLELIKAPLHCIEYVIVHELCHSQELHHGPEFEALLTRCLPDWRKRKERLEKVVIT